MSARDFFVTDEELEARLGVVQFLAPAPSKVVSDPAVLEALLQETERAYEQQFGRKATMFPLLLKLVIPALVLGMVIAFSLAVNTNDSASASESTSIPSPCRG